MAAASANLKTPCGRSKTFRPPANRFTSHVPASASRVLPVAMAHDVATFPAVVTFTRNAPIKMAGDEVDYRQDADAQQPRETSRLHRPSAFTRHLDRHFGMPQNSRHLGQEMIQVRLA